MTTTPTQPLNELETLRREHEALKAAHEQLQDDYLSAGGTIAIVASWLRGEKGSMSDLSVQQIYDMIADDYGYNTMVIDTVLVQKVAQP